MQFYPSKVFSRPPTNLLAIIIADVLNIFNAKVKGTINGRGVISMTSKQLQEIADSYRRLGGIEALEKIKAKINLEDVDCQYEEDYMYSGGLQKAIEIIGKEISELKGEAE